MKDSLLREALNVLISNNLNIELQNKIKNEIEKKSRYEQIGYISMSEDSVAVYISAMEGKIVKIQPYMAHWMCWWKKLYIEE